MTSEVVNVAIDKAYLDRFSEVVARCRTAGLRVDQQLMSIGIVTGEIAPEHRAALEQVEGVRAVETAGTFQLNPPDSDIQ